MQTYPQSLMQVIVVADACTDTTIDLVKDYQASYDLQLVEANGQGPAVARNKGAAIATGQLLLFLDDDIDPCEQLVSAHVAAHKTENSVVIGYLPFPISGKASFFKQRLRAWWEDKFFNLLNPGHRYSHEDLLTGNVSMPIALFKKVNGFNEDLKCREDYELGIRLMKEKALFTFSKKAWGFHRDEVTNLRRSLQRKRAEGKADVQCWRLHPEVTTSLQQAYAKGLHVLAKPKLVSLIIAWPKLTERIAGLAERFAVFAEYMHMRKLWIRLNLRLHNYWYLRGLLDELQTLPNLYRYLKHDPSLFIQAKTITINLEEGIEAAEHLLDQLRPAGIVIQYGSKELGRVESKLSSEPLQGKHLRNLLATGFPYPLLKAEAFKVITNQNGEVVYGAHSNVANHV